MSRTLACLVVACVVSTASARLYAGGPARLCLPIDGVTAENSTQCASRLTEALRPAVYDDVVMQQDEGEWYAAFNLKTDVSLSDVRDAFKGSGFTVPDHKLRLFGHVILEIQTSTASTDSLVTQLDELEHAAVDSSVRDE